MRCFESARCSRCKAAFRLHRKKWFVGKRSLAMKVFRPPMQKKRGDVRVLLIFNVRERWIHQELWDLLCSNWLNLRDKASRKTNGRSPRWFILSRIERIPLLGRANHRRSAKLLVSKVGRRWSLLKVGFLNCSAYNITLSFSAFNTLIHAHVRAMGRVARWG